MCSHLRLTSLIWCNGFKVHLCCSMDHDSFLFVTTWSTHFFSSSSASEMLCLYWTILKRMNSFHHIIPFLLLILYLWFHIFFSIVKFPWNFKNMLVFYFSAEIFYSRLPNPSTGDCSQGMLSHIPRLSLILLKFWNRILLGCPGWPLHCIFLP